MAPDQVALITEELDDDDVADILQQLPEAFTQQVLEAMDEQDRARLESRSWSTTRTPPAAS
jgi:magnesium transporter